MLIGNYYPRNFVLYLVTNGGISISDEAECETFCLEDPRSYYMEWWAGGCYCYSSYPDGLSFISSSSFYKFCDTKPIIENTGTIDTPYSYPKTLSGISNFEIKAFSNYDSHCPLSKFTFLETTTISPNLSQ